MENKVLYCKTVLTFVLKIWHQQIRPKIFVARMQLKIMRPILLENTVTKLYKSIRTRKSQFITIIRNINKKFIQN